MSDQWHSVDGHRIFLFHCHHSLTLGHTLVQITVMLNGTALRQMVMSLLETSHYSVHNVLVNKKSNAMLKFIFFSTEENLPLLLFHQKSSISFSQSPRTFHLYLSISCVSSWRFPAAVSHNLVSFCSMCQWWCCLPQIFDGAPVACLTPPSWCTADSSILVNPGGEWSGKAKLLVSLMVTQAGSTM